MPVFLSHKKSDAEIAREIYQLFQRTGIKCYMDELDEVLQKSTDITGIIMSRIVECTHMLAIVSHKTRDSWWVPFEIGVASKAERRISSYKAETVVLPEYLEIWPVMTKREHLSNFIKLYLRDKLILEKSLYKYETAEVRTAEEFHRKLKTAIGQRLY